MEKLTNYDFPGNVRKIAAPPAGKQPLSMREVESRYMAGLLKRFEGQRRPVAAAMGISERTLYRKLKRYGLSGASGG